MKLFKILSIFIIGILFAVESYAQLNYNARRVSLDTLRARAPYQGGITGRLEWPYNWAGTYPSIYVNDTILHEWIRNVIPPATSLTGGAGIEIIGDSVNVGGSFYNAITLLQEPSSSGFTITDNSGEGPSLLVDVLTNGLVGFDLPSYVLASPNSSFTLNDNSFDITTGFTTAWQIRNNGDAHMNIIQGDNGSNLVLSNIGTALTGGIQLLQTGNATGGILLQTGGASSIDLLSGGGIAIDETSANGITTTTSGGGRISTISNGGITIAASVSNVRINNTGTGPIEIIKSGSDNIELTQTGSGNIVLSQSGAGNISSTSVGGTTILNNGNGTNINLTDSNDGGIILTNNGAGAGSVDLVNNGTGGILLDNNAGNLLLDNDGTGIQIQNAGTGGINVSNTGGDIVVNNTSSGNSVSIQRNATGAGTVSIQNLNGTGNLIIQNGGGNTGNIQINAASTGGGIDITDSRATPEGITYAGSNYVTTSRSLTDRGYTNYILTGSLTDGAPTDAEIDAIYGAAPSAATLGQQFTIIDNDGTGHLYFIVGTSTNWNYVELSPAL